MSDCETTRDAAQAYLDGELCASERERVEAHLAGCSACRRLVARYRRLFAALDEPAVPEPPPTLVGAVMARVAASRARRECWLRWGATAAVAVAAVAVALVGWGQVASVEWLPLADAGPAAAAESLWDGMTAVAEGASAEALAERASGAAEWAETWGGEWLAAVPGASLLVAAALALLAGNAALAWRWRGLAALNGEHAARTIR